MGNSSPDKTDELSGVSVSVAPLDWLCSLECEGIDGRDLLARARR